MSDQPGTRGSGRRGRHGAMLAGALLVVMAAAEAPAGRLGDEIAHQVRTYQQRTRAMVGVSVVELPGGGSLADVQAGRPLTPASNQKLLTSAFALVRLGGSYRFTTTVREVKGHLAVVGDFDPVLGDPVLAGQRGESIYRDLDQWAQQVRRKIPGQVVGDILLYRPHPTEPMRHPDWPENQHDRWYAAPVAELNYHNNCFDVTFSLTNDRPEAHVAPSADRIEIIEKLSVGRRHLWSLTAEEMDRRLTVKGTIRRATGEPYSVPVDYPQLLLGRVFADRLRRAGVQVDGKVRMVTGDIAPIQAGRLIAATQNPLGDALLRANRRSLNMAAEGLLLRAGNGTWGGSSALMDSALTKAFGLRPGSLRVRDGSGLSKMNLASPEAITSVLVGLLRYKDSGEIIRSLPVSGGEGSLRKRMNTGIARGRVYAKTGTLSRVSALSGYVTDAAQRPRVAFSILVNRVPPGKVYQARRLQDDICRLLVEYAQSPERRKAGPRPTQPGPLHKDIRIKPRPLDESAPAR